MLSQQELEKVLGQYRVPGKDPWDFLKKIDTSTLPKAVGHFELPPETPYANHAHGYLTSPLAGICLNQLAYAAFADWMREGYIPGYEIDLDTFLEKQGRMFLTEKHERFRKPIPIGNGVEAVLTLADPTERSFSVDFADGSFLFDAKYVLCFGQDEIRRIRRRIKR